MVLPDICGFTLGKAKLILREYAVEDYTIRVTKRPGSEGIYNNNSRVIALTKTKSGQIELLVCNPEAPSF